MPQFDPANFFSQIAWLAAIFAFLYFAVVRPTLPKVGRVIDEREGRVSNDLDAAEAAKGEADAIRTRYDDGMQTAREAAQAQVAASQAAAAKAVEDRMRALADVLDGQSAAAAVQLAAARDTARAKLEATTTALTADAVQRLIGIDLPAASIEAALSAQK